MATLNAGIDASRARQGAQDFDRSADQISQAARRTGQDVDRLDNNIRELGSGGGVRGIEALAGGFRGLGAAVTAAVAAYASGELLGVITEAELASTRLDVAQRNVGRAFGYTRDQLRGIAQDISSRSIRSVSELNLLLANTVSFGNQLQGIDISRFTEAVVQTTAQTGEEDLLGVARGFRDAISDANEEGARARSIFNSLRTDGIAVSEAAIDRVQALLDQNRVLEAQRQIVTEILGVTQGAAEAEAGTLGGTIQQFTNAADNFATQLDTGPWQEIFQSVATALNNPNQTWVDLANGLIETTARAGRTGLEGIDRVVDYFARIREEGGGFIADVAQSRFGGGVQGTGAATGLSLAAGTVARANPFAYISDEDLDALQIQAVIASLGLGTRIPPNLNPRTLGTAGELLLQGGYPLSTRLYAAGRLLGVAAGPSVSSGAGAATATGLTATTGARVLRQYYNAAEIERYIAEGNVEQRAAIDARTDAFLASLDDPDFERRVAAATGVQPTRPTRPTRPIPPQRFQEIQAFELPERRAPTAAEIQATIDALPTAAIAPQFAIQPRPAVDLSQFIAPRESTIEDLDAFRATFDREFAEELRIDRIQEQLQELADRGVPGSINALNRFNETLYETEDSANVGITAFAGISDVLLQAAQGTDFFRTAVLALINDLAQSYRQGTGFAGSILGGVISGIGGAFGGGGGTFAIGGGGVNNLANVNRNALFGLVPQFQEGGFARRGTLGITGERGRELVLFGEDARVIPNRQTERMLGGNVINLSINIEGDGDEERIREVIRDEAPAMLAQFQQATRNSIQADRGRPSSFNRF